MKGDIRRTVSYMTLEPVKSDMQLRREFTELVLTRKKDMDVRMLRYRGAHEVADALEVKFEEFMKEEGFREKGALPKID